MKAIIPTLIVVQLLLLAGLLGYVAACIKVETECQRRQVFQLGGSTYKCTEKK